MLNKQIINNYFNRIRVDEIRPSHLWPSEASVKTDEGNVVGGCLRQAFYRIHKAVRKRPGPALSMRFEISKAVEKICIEAMKCEGKWMADHVRIYIPELKISGEIDLITWNNNCSGVYINEIKTYYGPGATVEIEGLRSYEPKPKESAVLQNFIYLKHIIDNPSTLPPDIKVLGGRLNYVNMATGHQEEFDMDIIKTDNNCYPLITPRFLEHDKLFGRKIEYHMTHLSWSKIIARYTKLIEYLTKAELPPRDFEMYYSDSEIEEMYENKKLSAAKYNKFKKKGERPGDWNCNYCRYSDVCYAPENE